MEKYRALDYVRLPDSIEMLVAITGLASGKANHY